MESKFTKGPWKLLEIDNRKLTYQFYIKGPDGISICKIERGNREDVEADRANAKAIAALPELIEALQAAKTELEMYIPVTDVKVLQQIQAAIAKALD